MLKNPLQIPSFFHHESIKVQVPWIGIRGSTREDRFENFLNFRKLTKVFQSRIGWSSQCQWFGHWPNFYKYVLKVLTIKWMGPNSISVSPVIPIGDRDRIWNMAFHFFVKINFSRMTIWKRELVTHIFGHSPPRVILPILSVKELDFISEKHFSETF